MHTARGHQPAALVGRARHVGVKHATIIRELSFRQSYPGPTLAVLWVLFVLFPGRRLTPRCFIPAVAATRLRPGIFPTTRPSRQ